MAISLRERALNLLARREQSVNELTQKLARFATEEEITTLISQLQNEKLQSEARYTEMFVNAKIARGQGMRSIVHALQQQKISTDLINEYLPNTAEFWQERIQTIWQKKYHGNVPNDIKQRLKQTRFLMQRGFTNAQVQKFFNTLHLTTDEF